MKILVLTLDFRPGTGGVETYLYETLRRFEPAHEVIVATPAPGQLPEEGSLRKMVVAKGSARVFRRLIRAVRPDRLLLGHAHPQLLLAAVGGRYATIAHGNDYLAAQKRWHRPLFNWLLGRSRPLITQSNANERRLLALGLPATVVHPGADANRFLPAAPSERPTLLTVGRLVSRKGIDKVLEAVSLMRPDYPQLSYVVAGDGPDRNRLENLSRSLMLDHTVQFVGTVSEAELAALYQRAHVFVMPAREESQPASLEGFGIVYLEASACGLPVVAGRSGGAVEAVRDGETGFLVPPEDAAAVASVLRRLLDDQGLRQRLGRAGRRWVESEMNWDRPARRLQRLLERS